MNDNMKRVLAYIKSLFTTNPGMKAVALLLALLLWSFVVATTNPIRVKTVDDVAIESRGLTQLSERGLIIKNEYPGTADVRLDVPQNDYLAVNANNVTCVADFSRITDEGEQRVYLTASYSGGDASSVSPAYITVVIEQMLTRDIPIRTQLSGEVMDGYWRGAPSLNKNAVTVTGARSVVEAISYAEVTADVEGAAASISVPLDYAIYTADGALVEEPNITTSPSNCIMSVDVLPVSIVPVELLLTGTVAEGYNMTERSVTPAFVRIAAAQDVLDGIVAVTVPLVVDGATESIEVRAKPQLPTGVRWCGTSDIAVSVSVREDEETVTFERLDVLPFNAASEAVAIDPASVTVEITGPRSVVRAIERSEIEPYVDLNGFGAGEFLLQVRTRVEYGRPGLSVKVQNPLVSVVIE